MSSVGKAIGKVTGALTGSDKAAKASYKGAETAAKYQEKALDYLKETEKIPQQFREGALMQLGGLYGLEGGEGTPEEFIAGLERSPLYEAIVGGRQAGEEAIMRQAAATGGLRSGNIQEALYDYNTQLENQALLQAYNQQVQGLGGLAQLPSLAPQIAQTQAGIGQTLGQGIVGQGQAVAQGRSALLGGLMSLGGSAMTGGLI